MVARRGVKTEPDYFYLVGMMRSGTTLIGEYIGSVEGCVCVGELINTWRSALRGQGCSCGREVSHCPVWSLVFDGTGASDWELLDGIRSAVDRRRWTYALLILLAVPEAYWPRSVRAYVLQLRRQVELLRIATGARVIIDTSKSPAGLALARLAFGRHMGAVLVIRDPRAVAFSQSQHVHRVSRNSLDVPEAMSVRRSAALWLRMTIGAHVAALGVAPRRRFIYETLGSNPEGALERLVQDLHLVGQRPSWEGADAVLASSHVLAGNPSRLDARRRSVRPDHDWQTQMPRPHRWLVLLRTMGLYRLLACTGHSYLRS